MAHKCLSTWPKLILYGDSLTQYSFSEGGCWGSRLADLLQRKCDVLNRGFSGYNSTWNRLMLPKLVTASDAQSVVGVVIFLGANDSNKPESAQHVNVDDYKNNLVAMVKYLKSIGISSRQIVLMGPPPCDEKAWQAECQAKSITMYQDNGYKKQYSVGCRLAAADTNTRHVDLFLSMRENMDWSSYFCDGLHFSQSGSEFVFTQLRPLIEEITGALPVIMPDWKNVNPQNPDESL